MKKVFLIAAMIVATLSANAQAEPGTLTIQPHVGGSAGMFTNSDGQVIDKTAVDIEKDANGGGVIGVELEYQVAKRLGIAAGVNYMQAGTAWKDVDKNGYKYKDMKLETGCVSVPVVANFYLCKGLALKSGVQFNFLTNAKLKATSEKTDGNFTSKVEYDRKVMDSFNKFDVAIPVGLSYEFKVPIVIDFRYNIGLTKINKDDIFNDRNCKSHTCTITVGYKFKL